jgi:hypothetical protein
VSTHGEEHPDGEPSGRGQNPQRGQEEVDHRGEPRLSVVLRLKGENQEQDCSDSGTDEGTLVRTASERRLVGVPQVVLSPGLVVGPFLSRPGLELVESRWLYVIGRRLLLLVAGGRGGIGPFGSLLHAGGFDGVGDPFLVVCHARYGNRDGCPGGFVVVDTLVDEATVDVLRLVQALRVGRGVLPHGDFDRRERIEQLGGGGVRRHDHRSFSGFGAGAHSYLSFPSRACNCGGCHEDCPPGGGSKSANQF